MSPSANLHWVTVGDPKNFKDPRLLTENRRHVMMDFLTKGGRKPARSVRASAARLSLSPRDRAPSRRAPIRWRHQPRRVNRATSFVESTPPARQPASSLNTTTTAPTANTGTTRIRNPPALEVDVDQIPQVQPPDLHSFADVTPALRAPVGGADSPLIHPPSGSLYRRTSFSDVPFSLGSPFNPFKTWPCLDEPLNTTKLKHNCSKYFGTEMLARSWVPTLLKARHAFLSTICISAAHDDIMQRALQAPNDRQPFESTDRFFINAQVCNMINSALNDPDMRIADSTIIAVLQVLSSEIMGCDDSVMAMHQKGLHVMVQQRGGLNNLGVDGKLASVLTNTMYMISALRETIPHRDYEEWAAKSGTRPSEHARKIPESPVFCRSSGYDALKNMFPPDSPTFALLENLRLLTKNFVRASGHPPFTPLTPVDPNNIWEQDPRNRMHEQHNAIFALTPAASHPAFYTSTAPTRTSDHAKHSYEAVRLAGLIYAYALNNDLPLSSAAATLSAKQPHSIHVLIKRSLLRTDLSACWGDAAGLLFWTTLIASAAANPACATNASRRASAAANNSNNHNKSNNNNNNNQKVNNKNLNGLDNDGDDEVSRKWLAAVAVRCSIVLGFEHGRAVLETLKRLVGLEQVLAARATAAATAAATTEGQQQQQQQQHESLFHEAGVAIPGSGISLNAPLLPCELRQPLLPTEVPLTHDEEGFLVLCDGNGGGGASGLDEFGGATVSALASVLASGAARASSGGGGGGGGGGDGGGDGDGDRGVDPANYFVPGGGGAAPMFGPDDVPFWQRRANFADFADDFRDVMD